MSLQALKDSIRTTVTANTDIKIYYDSRYKAIDIVYTAFIFELITALSENKYIIKFKIIDKLSAQGDNYNKTQSNTLITIKAIIYELAKVGILDYKLIKYTPFNDGDSTGFETNEITIVERKSCV